MPLMPCRSGPDAGGDLRAGDGRHRGKGRDAVADQRAALEQGGEVGRQVVGHRPQQHVGAKRVDHDQAELARDGMWRRARGGELTGAPAAPRTCAGRGDGGRSPARRWPAARPGQPAPRTATAAARTSAPSATISPIDEAPSWRAWAPATTPLTIPNVNTAITAPTSQPGQAGWSAVASEAPNRIPPPIAAAAASRKPTTPRRPEAPPKVPAASASPIPWQVARKRSIGERPRLASATARPRPSAAGSDVATRRRSRASGRSRRASGSAARRW